MAPEPGPILLAGVDRSGIGLLGEVLEMHPDVSMTRRTNFWSYVDGRYGALSERANVERCLDALAADRRTAVFAPDRERLWQALRSGPADYPALFRLLQEQLMERRGRRRWGDKSLGAERHAERLLQAYPDARFVHVLRDPRDRYASQLHHRGVGRGDISAGAAMWRWSEVQATRLEHRHPDRYRVVRYEDLVGRPSEVLHGVADFLALRRADGDTSRLSTASAGRYRRDLPDGDSAFLQLATRTGMRRRGYRPDPDLQSGASAWRRLPGRGVRMALWAPITSLRHRRGLAPSAKRVDADADAAPLVESVVS